MITSSYLELLLRLIPERLVAVAVGMMVLTGASFGEERTDTRKSAPAPVISEARDSAAMIDAARERAKLLHEVYESMLDVMHHRYFRQDGPVLPSRALEDVFEEMEATNGDKANWIAVNTKAMSINHEAKTAFEKTSVAELAAGKDFHEEVDKGVSVAWVATPRCPPASRKHRGLPDS